VRLHSLADEPLAYIAGDADHLHILRGPGPIIAEQADVFADSASVGPQPARGQAIHDGHRRRLIPSLTGKE